MRDLDRALRDLLTDEHLNVPPRPDAVRIVHDGVQRRRRRRTIVMSTAAAATTGAIVAAALVVPAALQAGGTNKTTPVQPNLSYDVAWVDQSAPKLWSPPPNRPKPPTMNAPRCTASQLRIGTPQNNGATGMLFTTIPLRNTSTDPCLLVGKPLRVAAQTPGLADVDATRGLHLGSSGVGGDLQPGKSGYLTIETDRDCPARYANPDNTYPTNEYTSLSVTLPSGTSLSLPLRLDVECGLRTGGLGVDQPPARTPPDPRGPLRPTMSAPTHVRAGTTLTYVVALTNPTSATISLRHCPGYLATLTTGSSDLAKEYLGLDCSTVNAIGAGQSVRYEMRLTVPADAGPGPATLRWSLVAGRSPAASARVLIQSA